MRNEIQKTNSREDESKRTVKKIPPCRLHDMYSEEQKLPNESPKHFNNKYG